MGKILIFIYDGMADFEITFLIHLLVSDCNKKIEVISNTQGTIKSMSGMTYVSNKGLKDVTIDEAEGIVIPGGSLEPLDDKLMAIIQHLNKSNKLIAAICFAPWILAKAGVLSGRKYTTSISEWGKEHSDLFGIPDPFPRDGYVEARVIRDGNIITTKGSAFIDFAMEVCDYYGRFKDETEKEAFGLEFK